jgi:DNA sulfur modification protein DndB
VRRRFCFHDYQLIADVGWLTISYLDPATTFLNTIAPFIELQQHERVFLVIRLLAGLLSRISYASVRQVDQEEGAVQRVLNSWRIAAIKDFTLAGGDYPNSIVLNWVNHSGPLLRSGNMLTVPDVARSAQLINLSTASTE